MDHFTNQTCHLIKIQRSRPLFLDFGFGSDQVGLTALEIYKQQAVTFKVNSNPANVTRTSSMSKARKRELFCFVLFFF